MPTYQLSAQIQSALGKNREFENGFRYRRVELPLNTVGHWVGLPFPGISKRGIDIKEANLHLLWKRGWEERVRQRFLKLFYREKTISHDLSYKARVELIGIPLGNVQSGYNFEVNIPFLGLTNLRTYRTCYDLSRDGFFSIQDSCTRIVCPTEVKEWFCEVIEAGTGVI